MAENQQLLLTKIPIHNRLISKKPRFRAKLEVEYLTDSSQSTEDALTAFKQQLVEPQEKVTLIERAVGYFNAENDVEAQNNALNLSTNEGPPFICKICNQWFYLGAKLKLHYITNHKYCHCEICSILFETFDEKTAHLSKYHSPMFCEICQNYFENLPSLIEHYEIEHDSCTCQFCGILLQPKNLASSHIIRKHHVNEKYLETYRNILENTENRTEFYCALCNKNREMEIFFGHMHSHHKLNITSLLNLIVSLNVRISVIGAKKAEIQGDKEDVVYKNSCAVCLTRFSKKIPEKFHQIYCQAHVQCKHCEKHFLSSKFLDKHLSKSHLKFFCQLNCQKLAFNTEENLFKHYTKSHDSVLCRYCPEFVISSNFEAHLQEKHKYKAVIMKNFTDTLFEVTEKESKHIVICCLCDENITLLSDKIKDIFQHYNLIHSVNILKIYKLIGAKPVLEDYEDFYREINESIKTETVLTDEACSSEIKIKIEQPEASEIDSEVSDDEIPKYKRTLADYSHLSAEIESDYDYSQSEILLNSDSELDDSNDLICRFCPDKFPKIVDLLTHLKETHKLRTKYNKFGCNYCTEVSLNSTKQANHILTHIETPNFDISSEMFNCTCENMQVVKSLARKHILEVHVNDLSKYSIQEFGLGCKYCPEKFWKRFELNKHEIEQHINDPTSEYSKCGKCLDLFSSTKCLALHFQENHPDLPQFTNFMYKCLNCETTYPSLLYFQQHFNDEHPTSKIFRCPVQNCFKTCKKKKYMLCHLSRPHEKEKELEKSASYCDVCGKKFKSYKAATIHKLMKHERDRAGFQCRICNERFSTSEQRKLHYTTAHPGQLAYNCLECGKGFISKSGLYGHRKVHQENNNLTCPYCNKQFSRRDSYNEHLLIHIGPRHQCPHCAKSFTQRSNLTRHVRIHTGAKPYQCCYCDKRFSDRGACSSHERVHTKEEHCECEYCGKKFTKKQKLKYHLRYHTGEGLLTCETCGKQFSNTYSLNEHKRTHNNETLVMCDCGRGFATEKYLNRHMQTVHKQNMTKYICPICFKPLFQKSSYNAHIMTHSSVKHVKCLLCNKEYNTKKTVKRHLMEEHNLRGKPDILKHIYQLTPQECGLNLPPASEMAIKVVNEQNLINLDVAKMQETFSQPSGAVLPAELGAQIQIKEERVSESSTDGSDDETPLILRKNDS